MARKHRIHSHALNIIESLNTLPECHEAKGLHPMDPVANTWKKCDMLTRIDKLTKWQSVAPQNFLCRSLEIAHFASNVGPGAVTMTAVSVLVSSRSGGTCSVQPTLCSCQAPKQLHGAATESQAADCVILCDSPSLPKEIAHKSAQGTTGAPAKPWDLASLGKARVYEEVSCRCELGSCYDPLQEHASSIIQS